MCGRVPEGDRAARGERWLGANRFSAQSTKQLTGELAEQICLALAHPALLVPTRVSPGAGEMGTVITSSNLTSRCATAWWHIWQLRPTGRHLAVVGHSPPRLWGGPCGPTCPSPTCTSPSRRDRIARIGLGVILNLAKERDIPPLAQSVSGILEHMFKHTEETCSQLISDGGLDAILYWCRWTDPVVLRHCAMALANCAMHGGQANQRLMIEKRTAEWLFPLVFSRDDELIRLHACLAITVLATNKEIEKEVERSGTLALVEPFIASLDPERFACRMLGSSDSSQGRTAEDLQRLVPLLDSSRLEAQCIAAFYLCAEAAIKTRQKQTKVKGEVGPGEGGAKRERRCCCIPMWFVPP